MAQKSFKSIIIDKSDDEKREGALIFLGDMILLDDYSYVMERYYESNVDGIITVMKVPKEDASSYGVVEIDKNNLITKLIEKPEVYVSNLAIAGIYAFSYSTIQALFGNIKKYLEHIYAKSLRDIYSTYAPYN